MSNIDMYKNYILGRKEYKYRSPDTEAYWIHVEKNLKIIMAGVKWMREKLKVKV